MYIAVVLLLVTLSTVLALPTGAPFCTVGEAAPGNPHKANFTNDANVTLVPRTGPLSNDGFIVTVGGVTLDPLLPLTVFSKSNISIVATSLNRNETFKGVLIIISRNYSNFTNDVELKPIGSDVKVAGSCNMTGKAGFTHSSNITKTEVNGTLYFPGNISNVQLDVNIVVSNNRNEGSVYFYNHFTLVVVNKPPPTPAPVGPPTKAPVSPPTKAPIRKKCGLFGLSIFCPFTFCGWLGRLIFGNRNC